MPAKPKSYTKLFIATYMKVRISISNPYTLTIVLALLFCNYGIAQNKRILPLDEALQLAQAHSKQLKLDSLDILSKESKVIQGRNASVPQVSLNLGYVRISDNITPFKVNFPGGDVELNPQILNQSYNSLQVRQLVVGGNKIKYGLEALRYDKQVAYTVLQKNANDLNYTIANIWYNLFVLKKSKQVIEANIDLLTKQKKDVQNFIDQGIVLANDGLKIDLAITNYQSNLIDIDNSISQLAYNLCLLTGLPTNTDIDIPPSFPQNNKEKLGIDYFMSQTLANSRELKALSIRQNQADLGLRVAQDNYLPTVSVGGKVNYDQPNQRLFPNRAVLTGTWDIGIFLNWNISDLFTNKENIAESKIKIRRSQVASEQLSEAIQIEINADYSNYLKAVQKIAVAKKALEEATENFRVEKNRFSENTTTPTEFLTANTQLTQANINLTTAEANAELAYRKLLKSTN